MDAERDSVEPIGRSRSTSIGSHASSHVSRNSGYSSFSAYSQISQAARKYNAVVCAQDVVEGIFRVAEADPALSSSSYSLPSERERASSFSRSASLSGKSLQDKKQHTLMSRLTKLKSIVGLKQSSSQFAAITTTAEDFDTIFNDWTTACEREGCPLTAMDVVRKEFEKRKKQSMTKEAKAKIDLSHCDLTDEQMKYFVKAIARTPKVSTFDFRHNPRLSEESKRLWDHLTLCQVEASRYISTQHPDMLAKAIFLQEIKFSSSSAASVETRSRSDSHSSTGSGSSSQSHLEDDSRAKSEAEKESLFSVESKEVAAERENMKIELEHNNAKSQIRICCINETENFSVPLDEKKFQRLWKKLVGSSPQRLAAYREMHPEEDVIGSYEATQKALIWGMLDCGKLHPIKEIVPVENLDLSAEQVEDEIAFHDSLPARLPDSDDEESDEEGEIERSSPFTHLSRPLSVATEDDDSHSLTHNTRTSTPSHTQSLSRTQTPTQSPRRSLSQKTPSSSRLKSSPPTQHSHTPQEKDRDFDDVAESDGPRDRVHFNEDVETFSLSHSHSLSLSQSFSAENSARFLATEESDAHGASHDDAHFDSNSDAHNYTHISEEREDVWGESESVGESVCVEDLQGERQDEVLNKFEEDDEFTYEEQDSFPTADEERTEHDDTQTYKLTHTYGHTHAHAHSEIESDSDTEGFRWVHRERERDSDDDEEEDDAHREYEEEYRGVQHGLHTEDVVVPPESQPDNHCETESVFRGLSEEREGVHTHEEMKTEIEEPHFFMPFSDLDIGASPEQTLSEVYAPTQTSFDGERESENDEFEAPTNAASQTQSSSENSGGTSSTLQCSTHGSDTIADAHTGVDSVLYVSSGSSAGTTHSARHTYPHDYLSTVEEEDGQKNECVDSDVNKTAETDKDADAHMHENTREKADEDYLNLDSNNVVTIEALASQTEDDTLHSPLPSLAHLLSTTAEKEVEQGSVESLLRSFSVTTSVEEAATTLHSLPTPPRSRGSALSLFATDTHSLAYLDTQLPLSSEVEKEEVVRAEEFASTDVNDVDNDADGGATVSSVKSGESAKERLRRLVRERRQKDKETAVPVAVPVSEPEPVEEERPRETVLNESDVLTPSEPHTEIHTEAPESLIESLTHTFTESLSFRHESPYLSHSAESPHTRSFERESERVDERLINNERETHNITLTPSHLLSPSRSLTQSQSPTHPALTPSHSHSHSHSLSPHSKSPTRTPVLSHSHDELAQTHSEPHTEREPVSPYYTLHNSPPKSASPRKEKASWSELPDAHEVGPDGFIEHTLSHDMIYDRHSEDERSFNVLANDLLMRMRATTAVEREKEKERSAISRERNSANKQEKEVSPKIRSTSQVTEEESDTVNLFAKKRNDSIGIVDYETREETHPRQRRALSSPNAVTQPPRTQTQSPRKDRFPSPVKSKFPRSPSSPTKYTTSLTSPLPTAKTMGSTPMSSMSRRSYSLSPQRREKDRERLEREKEKERERERERERARDWERIEVRALHPAFRRHDGRHKALTVSAQAQDRLLQRMRNSQGDFIDFNHNSSNENNGNGENNDNTQSASLDANGNPNEPPPVDISSPSFRDSLCVWRERERDSERKRRLLHAQQRLFADNANNANSNIEEALLEEDEKEEGEGEEEGKERDDLAVKRAVVTEPGQELSRLSFPNRLDLSKQGKTTQTLKFSEYLSKPQMASCLSLSLHGNALSLPDRLFLASRFTHLVELDLSHNALSTSFSPRCFPPTLRRLDLSHNALKNIAGLRHCEALLDLNLSHNKLRVLDPLPLTLQRLDVSYNWICDIAQFEVLHENTSLTWCMLASDEIPPAYLRIAAQLLQRAVPALRSCDPLAALPFPAFTMPNSELRKTLQEVGASPRTVSFLEQNKAPNAANKQKKGVTFSLAPPPAAHRQVYTKQDIARVVQRLTASPQRDRERERESLAEREKREREKRIQKLLEKSSFRTSSAQTRSSQGYGPNTSFASAAPPRVSQHYTTSYVRQVETRVRESTQREQEKQREREKRSLTPSYAKHTNGSRMAHNSHSSSAKAAAAAEEERRLRALTAHTSTSLLREKEMRRERERELERRKRESAAQPTPRQHSARAHNSAASQTPSHGQHYSFASSPAPQAHIPHALSAYLSMPYALSESFLSHSHSHPHSLSYSQTSQANSRRSHDLLTPHSNETERARGRARERETHHSQSLSRSVSRSSVVSSLSHTTRSTQRSHSLPSTRTYAHTPYTHIPHDAFTQQPVQVYEDRDDVVREMNERETSSAREINKNPVSVPVSASQSRKEKEREAEREDDAQSKSSARSTSSFAMFDKGQKIISLEELLGSAV